MKSVVAVIGVSMLMLTIGAVNCSAEKLLTAREVQNLFNDKTMTVQNERKSGKNTREEPFKAFTSSMGIAKTVYDDSSQTRAWNVADDGRMCFSRSLSRRRQGQTCGFIIQDGDTYLLYESKDIKEKSGRVVGLKKKDLLVSFTDFTSGNQL
ncbi:hypothetical protein [Desulfopila sp. IMCC35008]|uniref:hypothetical protein n=1 Tax=Desulfopila sp. IMCC35008 TaxID=2653858 RepID=UPI0013D6D22D|nr:hypothetical protein [Desulfopila sp. IMCC35008]